MPRPPCADESGQIYHVLNRGNARAEIFHKDGDYLAFEKIMAQAIEKYDIELYCYQLLPNRWH
jgi:putative transposase